MGYHATATALGVSPMTINADIKPVQNHTKEAAATPKTASTEHSPVQNCTENTKIEQPSVLQKPADETRARGAALPIYQIPVNW